MSLTGTWALILRPIIPIAYATSQANGMGTHTVCVTDDGFEFQGKTYRSLTKSRSTLPAPNGPDPNLPG